MQKTKVIMKIESYKDGKLNLSVDDWGLKAAIKGLSDLCFQKYGGYIKLEMSPPYRPRTTGKDSQNNLIWKLITLISQDTGNDLADVEEAAKERAIKRGYPARQNKLTGRIKPVSMTEISTVEASYLIDELLQICAEYGINTEV